jgi:hypothetical protein
MRALAACNIDVAQRPQFSAIARARAFSGVGQAGAPQRS